MTPILVFARAPAPGRTKTRLIPALGPEGAADLHRALLRHALASAAGAGIGPVMLWGTGDDPAGDLPALAREVGAELHFQPEGDLGARMQAALAEALGGADGALVVGSDCPWIDARALRCAAAELAGRDAVLGPAEDGGYVLLGTRRADPELFSNVPWGTEQVLAITRQRLESLGWDWCELEARGDVDRPEDLPALSALGEQWATLATPR